MSIKGNGGGGGENGCIWGGFIVEGDGLVVIVVCSVVFHTAVFVFYCSRFLFPLLYLRFSESKTLNVFLSKTKKIK